MSGSLVPVNADSAAPRLKIEYRPLSSLVPMAGNSKSHSTETTIASILKYGFRDPIGLDDTLNNGRGGIVEGHDRRAALIELKAKNCNAPDGILIDSDGDWLVPCIVGINAKTEAEAIGYSIDHNLTTVRGAGLDLTDEIKLFDKDLLESQIETLIEEGESLAGFVDLDSVLDAINSEGLEDEDVPEDNKDIYEEELEKSNIKCPSCGFEWMRK